MTRTFFVGNVPEEVKEVYDLVLKNQKQTIQEFKDGANVRLLTKMVENDFKLHNYDLIHALGHGVGLEIHEPPVISAKNDNPLKENMVITNEPGIYIPGRFGVRIEDTVQITKFGCISLTNSAKNYIVI
jgi:Xaa-Pro aminopeptidase